jgi:hypothetical protein
MKKWYKDILATAILFGVIGVVAGIPLLIMYGSTELAKNILKGLVVFVILVFLFGMWKLIRMLID